MVDFRLIDDDLTDVVHFVDGDELVVQRLRIRLLTHRGEHPLDGSVGLPWTDWLALRVLPIDEMRNVIAAEAALTPGIEEVRSVEVTDSNGVVRLTLNALLASAEVVTVTVSQGYEDPYAAEVPFLDGLL